MNWFTYILQCSDDSYYTGFTDDIEARLMDHNQGRYPKSYTFKRRPVQLVFHYRLPSAAAAKEFEKQIKGWRREKKEALIRGDWNGLPELSKRYENN